MSQVVVMMPNTLNRAFCAIDQLANEGAVKRADCAVLKSLYASGWQDGFVQGPIERIARSFGLTETRLMATLVALEKIQAVALRSTPSGETSVELLSLCRPWVTGDVMLGWWQYYLVDNDDETYGNDAE
jgi:hypothetical protein